MKKRYKHLFFDLDKTLWDFDANNRKAFQEIFNHFQLQDKGIPSPEHFFNVYIPINLTLWDLYKKDQITKKTLSTERFNQSLQHYNIKDIRLAQNMAVSYLETVKKQTILFPQTLETLDLLKGKYHMHIITNGFNEVQFDKLKNSGLQPYFQEIITSELAACKKPGRGIFDYALEKTGAKAEESLIIGDDAEADILGGQNAGWDQLWVKHNTQEKANPKATYSVENIEDITGILN